MLSVLGSEAGFSFEYQEFGRVLSRGISKNDGGRGREGWDRLFGDSALFLGA